jgi:hypothetical protein
MQRLWLTTLSLAILAATAFLSLSGRRSESATAALTESPAPTAPAVERIQAESGQANPWTRLELNKAPRDFRFAIVTDRTGGHRPGIFPKAIEKLNLLQPEFVMSVGDLIEGYSQDAGQWALEWAEFQGKVEKLQSPFFYAVGNHDISNPAMGKNWDRKFGKRYYSFVYQDVLFTVLCSEDPAGARAVFGAEQRKWLQTTLDQNSKARWTFVFLHKPAWVYGEMEKGGWGQIERMLASRPHTVFAGHVHMYGRFVRNGGRDYIMLGTTGGGSQLRGKEYGEIDHVTWVTMKPSGPVIANLLLDGIEDKGFRTLPNAPLKKDQL